MLSKLSKWIISQGEKIHLCERSVAARIIQGTMAKPVSVRDLRGFPLVPNQKVEKLMKNSFASVYGGVHVLVAPPGAGKTTYIRNFAYNHIKNGGFVKYFTNELRSSEQFFAAFGEGKRSEDLFEVLPKKSVIVLDEFMRNSILNENMAGLLKHLAFESRRQSGVSVIVLTENMDLARDILHLNGNDKIFQNGTVADWKWTPQMVDQCIDQSPFRNWVEVDRNMLRKLAIKAACPAFLCNCADLLLDGSVRPDEAMLTASAEKFAQAWVEFESANLLD